MSVKEQVSLPTQRVCSRCKFVSSQEVCKACVLLEGLNKGLPKLGIGKSSKAKRMLDDYNAKQNEKLEEAINEINNESKKNNCISKGKVCRSTCKSKNAQSNLIDGKTDENTNTCNNERDANISNEKTNCCGDKICNRKDKANETSEPNSKAAKLLAEYGIPENNSVETIIPNGEESKNLISANNLSNDINSTREKESEKEISNPVNNEEFEVDLHTNDDIVLKEEDETCAGACGKIDSLHIGF